jgi:hypothetical protein
MLMQNSRKSVMVLGVLALALTVACGGDKMADEMGSASMQPAGAMAMDAAEYTLVFKNNWTAANHPVDYPASGAVSGPHFSGIVGAAHSASFSLFKPGMMPTPGLERLSEEGKPSPLDTEITAAVTAGSAASLFTTGPLRDLNDSLVATFRVDPQHPMVSFVAMIAPSPDWFAGAADVMLMENGAWVGSKTVTVYAYDSGGDEGTTYKASDADNNPKKPTMQAMSRHFAPAGTPVAVGTVTITKK